MKKIILTVIAAFCAAVAFPASDTKAKSPPGTDNVAFGYGAGFGSSGVNRDVVCIGTDAGMNSSDNVNCVFIGKDAGKGVSDYIGYFDILGLIKGHKSQGLVEVPIMKLNEMKFTNASGVNYVNSTVEIKNVNTKLDVMPERISMTSSKGFDLNGKPVAYMYLENGRLTVYTNGVEIGVLSGGDAPSLDVNRDKFDLKVYKRVFSNWSHSDIELPEGFEFAQTPTVNLDADRWSPKFSWEVIGPGGDTAGEFSSYTFTGATSGFEATWAGDPRFEGSSIIVNYDIGQEPTDDMIAKISDLKTDDTLSIAGMAADATAVLPRRGTVYMQDDLQLNLEGTHYIGISSLTAERLDIEPTGVIISHGGWSKYMADKPGLGPQALPSYLEEFLGKMFRVENGQMNVYTNNVKIGTLSFTPVSN